MSVLQCLESSSEERSIGFAAYPDAPQMDGGWLAITHTQIELFFQTFDRVIDACLPESRMSRLHNKGGVVLQSEVLQTSESLPCRFKRVVTIASDPFIGIEDKNGVKRRLFPRTHLFQNARASDRDRRLRGGEEIGGEEFDASFWDLSTEFGCQIAERDVLAEL